ncbi:MAG: hypothetical protein NTW56_01690 [Alphaproteobacteria bacterium]|nr:hypothetical protein [Alphaproteobacteria bacterium]
MAVVIGAGGGIGAALFDALRASGGYRDVVAFSRASTPRFDITDEASVRDAAASLAPAVPLLVIDATGFLHDAAHRPEKSWRELDPAQMARAFALNAIGPALLMKHFQRWLGKFGQPDEWISCLTAAKVPWIRSEHDEANPPDA